MMKMRPLLTVCLAMLVLGVGCAPKKGPITTEEYVVRTTRVSEAFLSYAARMAELPFPKGAMAMEGKAKQKEIAQALRRQAEALTPLKDDVEHLDPPAGCEKLANATTDLIVGSMKRLEAVAASIDEGKPMPSKPAEALPYDLMTRVEKLVAEVKALRGATRGLESAKRDLVAALVKVGQS